MHKKAPNYYVYIRSPEWRAKGKRFKEKVGDRCQAFPWIKLKYYSIHHCGYENLGSEKWNIDCIVLSKTAHRFVHSWLTGSWRSMRVSEQNKKRWRYPNVFQRLFHYYARFVGVILYIGSISNKRFTAVSELVRYKVLSL